MKKRSRIEDEEDMKIIRSYERGEWIPVENQEEFMAMARKAATRYFKERGGSKKKDQKKDRRINIRTSGDTLDKIKRIAAGEGLPYQTYISSALYKIANRRMKDMDVDKR